MINIQIIEGGPAIITTTNEALNIMAPILPGNEDSYMKVASCRCGKSSNGIYCDGSHSKKYDEGGYEIKD